MQSRLFGWVFLLVAAASACSLAQSSPTPARNSTSTNQGYGRLPLTFEANGGQTDRQAKFISRGQGYTAFLTIDGMVLSLRTHQADPGSVSSASKRATLQFRLLGAAKNVTIVGENQKPGRVNYFMGNDRTKWHTNVPTYGQVRYKNIYPGIDLVYYGSNRQLEYDFAVSPGADPGKIHFQILGARQINVGSDGDLVLDTGSGELHFKAPIVYQEANGQRLAVNGGYVIDDPTHISFRLSQYDANKPLVIDPVLLYSTYLGGSGNDQPGSIAVDSAGSVYIVGSTDSTDFPLAALGSLPAGSPHVFVAKLDPTGSNLVYADYLGGSNQDYGYAIALDATNNVYVTGSTASSDFPVVNAFQPTYPGSYNAFLTSISADGSSLLYSTYFGGNGSDIPSGIAVDASGDMLITGITSSTNLPVANAYQSTVSANQGGMYGYYGFLTKFTPDGSSLVYSTYFGGNTNVPLSCGPSPCWTQPDSFINGMALDLAGNAYVAGYTNTYNFPVTSGAYLTTNSVQQNDTVSFLSKFSPAGGLQYSTYFYDPNGFETDITAVAVDSSGSAYVTGLTFGNGTFPITSTGICDPAVYGSGCNYAFVTKFDSAASTLLYSTYLGPNNVSTPQAIALDANNNAYILASTTSASFTTVNGVESYSSGNDVLLAEIDAGATTQVFATYLGGSGDDEPTPGAMAVDSSGNIYAAGMTSSSDFPVTQPAFQTIFGGNTDAFVLKIGPGSAPAVSLNPNSLQYTVQQIGTTSQAQTVLLHNMGSAPLAISSLMANGDFAEADDCGTSVPAAGNCTVSITFTPTAGGLRNGSVVIQDGSATSPEIISLSGTGSGVAVSLSPGGLTFSSQVIGTSSTAQIVTLTSSGTAALAISNLQVTGDFTQTNNCPASLAAGTTCTVNVIFTPTASGTRTGTLTVSDNAWNTPQTVSLSGIGASGVASASVAPSSLTFSSQAVGTSSAAQTVTITSSGSAALTISNFQVSGDFTQTNNCPASLASGANCTINVTFTPTASGTRTGTLIFTSNAQNSPQMVSLTGTGASTAPSAVVSPTSLTFSSQIVGTSSAVQTVTLSNSGNAALTISSVQVSGDFTQTNNCPASLASGTTCTVNVTFTPTASGTRTGALTFIDNAQNSPQTVSLSGTGVSTAPSATMAPISLSFSSQVVGTSSAAQTVTFTNSGNTTLIVSNVHATGDYAQTNNCPATLSAGANCTINVTFTPTVSGNRAGSLTVTDSAQNSPQTVALSGTGSDFSLASTPNSDTIKAGATATYTLNVASVGGTFGNAVKLSCSGAPAKSTCSLSSSSVTPGANPASVTVTVQTTGTSAAVVPLRAPRNQPLYAVWMQLQGFGLFGMMLAGRRRRNNKLAALFVMAIVLASLLFMAGCAGGTGIAPQTQGTQPGTYTITVSGTSGALQHSVPLTLIVQ